jgi:hypothetical protein
MPKQTFRESVLHDWVLELPFQMQALLLTAMRGPDNMPKQCNAKPIVRYLRGVVCKPAGDWSGKNDNSFMWGEYVKIIEKWHQHERLPDEHRQLFQTYCWQFWDDHDQYPHHFIMHLVHCAEVIGYYHPDKSIRGHWLNFYASACESFHMDMETKDAMDERLNDFGCGIHNNLKDIQF